jgi:hypothetical protein
MFESASSLARTAIQNLRAVALSPKTMLKIAICGTGLCSMFISGATLFLTVIFYDPHSLGASASWLSISVAGISLLIFATIGLRGTILVNLELLLTYFWGIIVFISALTLAVVASLDAYQFIYLWQQHTWEKPSYLYMREMFCHPKSTSHGKCLAPLTVPNVTSWCVSLFNATDCADIRANAVDRAEKMLQSLTLSLGLVEMATMLFIFMSVYLSYMILTPPVISQSMSDIANYLLILPTAACVGLSFYLSQYNLPSFAAIAYIFIALAVAQIVALPLGIAAARLKSQLMITAYLILITLITAAYMAAATLGLLFSQSIVQYPPTLTQTETIACSKSLGCCCCDQRTVLPSAPNRKPLLRCPSWTQSEIITLLSLDLKIAGFVSIVSALFVVGAWFVGFIVWKNLRNYKSAFI